MQMYPLAIATAQIRHRRYLPKSHHFQTELTYLWFDPDRIAEFTSQSYLWSNQRFNFLTLNENDFLSVAEGSIREKITAILKQDAHFELEETMQIRVLALPRTLGFRFNSVVFYWVFNQHHQLQFALSEITNTPWNERKVYVHDCRVEPKVHGEYLTYQFDFKKDFHVSPFMPMSIDYRWRFSFSDQQNIVHMQLFQQDILQFDATMLFDLKAITLPSQQHRYAITKVLEPFKMVTGIYVNALRLWIKKVPFYRHPKKDKGNTLL